jgi:hypothetical protein
VTLIEPWVMMRLFVGAVATLLFGYGAVVGARVLRYAHLETASEGRLLIERHFELAATLVRIGAALQVFSTLLSVVAADRLSGSLRGAMCGYGVVGQNPWGWLSIAVGAVASLGAAVVLQLFSLDRRVRGLDLLRSLSVGCVILAPLVGLDWGLCLAWLTRLDLSVVASCCSTTLDGARRDGALFWQGPRVISAWAAAAGIPFAVGAALFARRRPARSTVALSGLATLAILPVAMGAAVLEVAPHVYQVPEHLCPFCLFKADAYFIGYPLFGAMFMAATWGLGGAAAAWLSTGAHAREAFPSFARSRMTWQAAAWTLALVLGAAPVALYAVNSPGASLFR